MAFDTNFRTTQEYLNLKAGTVGRTKQECLQILSGRFSTTNNVIITQDAANSYTGGTQGKTKQDTLNNKVGAVNNTLTSQEAARRL